MLSQRERRSYCSRIKGEFRMNFVNSSLQSLKECEEIHKTFTSIINSRNQKAKSMLLKNYSNKCCWCMAKGRLD